MRAVAINIGANTNEPGFRGPIDCAGQFEYVPIPESHPTRETVPTYGDLDLDCTTDAVRDVPVHLDPEFPDYPHGERYTYGDEHGVKAGPLSKLRQGDYLLFYATLSTAADQPPEWQPPNWGAYVIGQFLVDRVLTGEAYRGLPADERKPFANNAHIKRETFDARVLVLGDPDGSRLYDRGIPLSDRDAGISPNYLVNGLSNDSGQGPWWRRPLRFDSPGTDELLTIVEEWAVQKCFSD